VSLIEFARGPALWFSLAVLAAGAIWRVLAIWRLGARPDLSEPRASRPIAGATRGILVHMLPRKGVSLGTALAYLNGYVYHVGLAVIVLAYLPHIHFIKRLTGLSWPALPEPMVFIAVGLTFVSLFIALLARLTDPVRRLLSDFDDYFSWFVVFLPLATGMIALQQSYAAGGAPGTPLDPAPLALHLLSVELLFVWLPFGKLGHAFLVFFSRGITGAAAARKGAAI
jgi:hypothetical protein